MNMNKALQHLYKAVSGQDTSKVNISKLLVDIHKTLTGKDSANKNNWARIIDSMAENWSGGGGGSSDFSTAMVTTNITKGENYLYLPVIKNTPTDMLAVWQVNAMTGESTETVPLYKGSTFITGEITEDATVTTTGDVVDYGDGQLLITGNCTITIS